MKCPACNGKLTSFDRQRGLSAHFVCERNINDCPKCGEPLSRVTTGSIRCKCLQPRIPQDQIDRPGDDRPSPQVRYGN